MSTLRGIIVMTLVLACGKPREQAANVQVSAPGSDSIPPTIRKKMHGFTEEERAFIDRARRMMKDSSIDVSGLEESISRFDNRWFVAYSRPGAKRGPGGGSWSVQFEYPSGKFIVMGREQ